MSTVLSRWEGRLATRRRLRDHAERQVAYWRKRFRAARAHTLAESHALLMLRLRKVKLALRVRQVRAAERVVARHRGDHPEPARGIDVSNHQGTVNFYEVAKAGYKFAYVKATEGTGFRDSYFGGNVTKARKAGLRVGGYHFLQPGHPDTQAAVFCARLKQAGLGKGDLMPVCDAEAEGVTASDVRAFVEGVRRRTGLDVLIYTFPAFINWPATYGCGLWIANFDVPAPKIPYVWAHYLIWQHSSTGSVPGVKGNCDVNVCPDLSKVIA